MRHTRAVFHLVAVVILAVLALPHASRAEEYMARDDLLALAFPGATPAPQTLWLNDALREQARAEVGLAPSTLRVRYWQSGVRTAWILDEIGKEQPITLGIVVDAGHIADLRVMAFRESRGWEIRHDFFTRQFAGVGLDNRGKLDQGIDGITGATLSVNATDRAARLALWLARQADTRAAAR